MSDRNSLTMTPATPTAATPTEVIDINQPEAWSKVREYWDASGKFETCKLYAQAMAGIELKALQLQLGISRGGDRRGSKSQNGTLIANFGDLAQKHVGLSRSHVYRLIQMGDALRKRMKKLPGLRDFAVLTLPMSALDSTQTETLQKGVRKLTDGMTQQDLFRSLGIYSAAGAGSGGARESSGGGDRSPEHAATTAKEIASADWTALDLMLRGYGDKFLLLPDADVTVQVAALEIALKARQKWLSKPRAQRDPQTLSAWLNGQLTGKDTAASEA